jgi:hypothetical protein
MYSAILALKKHGMDAKKDVKILATGGVSESLAAMQAHTVDAAVLSAPVTLRARTLGFRELLRMGQLGVLFMTASCQVRDTFRATKRMWKVFSKALLMGSRCIKRTGLSLKK